MKFAPGTSVKVVAGDFQGRTGEVDHRPGFPFRDARRVRLDPLPDATKRERLALVYENELSAIPAAARPPPPGQLSLFSEAA